MTDVITLVDSFIREASSMDAAQAERRLLPILKILAASDGFDLVEEVRPDTGATDFVANHRLAGDERLGIEYKHYEDSRVVDARAVDQVLLAAQRRNLSRIVLIARPGFSADATAKAAEGHPAQVQLFDFQALRSWAAQVTYQQQSERSQVVTVLAELSRELARIVARNPNELSQLEWRDLERMLAIVLDRLGFSATLTPSAKDGGKDIILELKTDGGIETYVVELKHWRAGSRVGTAIVRGFVEVVAREKHEGGLILASGGYTRDAASALSEIEPRQVRLGGQPKIINLCRTYVKAELGLWSPIADSALKTLFSETLGPKPDDPAEARA
jgi:restriction system protein